MLAVFALAVLRGGAPPRVTFESLLAEMSSRDSLARWPAPEYDSLVATSYNRESTRRDQPGWFADGDGTGYIRTIGEGEQKEYVLMEHEGPGCITKVWTPFFYYDFNERVGPHVRVYLDGNAKPIFDESLIKLVTGQGSVKAPWAAYSARAGNLYLPIPFGKSARVTMTAKPFYFAINYRAYRGDQTVETLTAEHLRRDSPEKVWAAVALIRPANVPPLVPERIAPGSTHVFKLPSGPHAVDQVKIWLKDALTDPSLLRKVVISAKFDGEETVWCPLGDFFCSADSVHPFSTQMRTVVPQGGFISEWVMPYRKSGSISITNLSAKPLRVQTHVSTKPWKWDERSMHFFARWRPDDVVPGTPFSDWNYVDVHGRGVYVGDAWTILNIRRDSWWGEGDEKIYVDEAWDRGFPTHFGTGTEDYYGWAGGVYPVKEDEFSAPFLANVKVGGLDGHTLGYNVVTRTRGLDAIPFRRRLRFDMESSFGTDMREKWNLLGYSAVTFFYAFPGAVHNRPADPELARKPIMSMDQLQRQSDAIRTGGQ